MAPQGFELVNPELLSIDDRLGMVTSARVLMGVDGSAMHTSAFVRPGTHVILVGNRTRPTGNLSQKAIDAVLGNPEAVLLWKGIIAESQDLDDHERRDLHVGDGLCQDRRGRPYDWRPPLGWVRPGRRPATGTERTPCCNDHPK